MEEMKKNTSEQMQKHGVVTAYYFCFLISETNDCRTSDNSVSTCYYSLVRLNQALSDTTQKLI